MILAVMEQHHSITQYSHHLGMIQVPVLLPAPSKVLVDLPQLRPANTGSCAYYTSQSLFQTWGSGSAYIGNDQFEIPTISYTYSEYSTYEFSSDADLLATVQTPTGAPTLATGGNWLLMGSNRSKTGYFYTKSDTFLSNVPGWNSTIYA